MLTCTSKFALRRVVIQFSIVGNEKKDASLDKARDYFILRALSF